MSDYIQTQEESREDEEEEAKEAPRRIFPPSIDVDKIIFKEKKVYAKN